MIFCPKRGNLLMIFISDAVTNENYCWIAWVNKNNYSQHAMHHPIPYRLAHDLKGAYCNKKPLITAQSSTLALEKGIVTSFQHKYKQFDITLLTTQFNRQSECYWRHNSIISLIFTSGYREWKNNSASPGNCRSVCKIVPSLLLLIHWHGLAGNCAVSSANTLLSCTKPSLIMRQNKMSLIRQLGCGELASTTGNWNINWKTESRQGQHAT